ncbi:CzcE family metal-binding protein [Massilia sp. S19_KUP03_FR1]|uniref:CzcE family metal-binding protein n=1 Tax=Massilia sp. S19_KUP03_FR1 TaxID=3025503 RepID=UPI002FCDDBDF
MQTTFAPLLLAGLLASDGAFALTAADQYGSPAGAQFTQRTIVIDSQTRYLNVIHGETVTIRSGNGSINWYFDGIGVTFDLAKIMPAAATGQMVRVYVEPGPLN